MSFWKKIEAETDETGETVSATKTPDRQPAIKYVRQAAYAEGPGATSIYINEYHEASSVFDGLSHIGDSINRDRIENNDGNQITTRQKSVLISEDLNYSFIGRIDVLKTVYECILKYQYVSLVGPRGVGKSAIAMKFASDFYYKEIENEKSIIVFCITLPTNINDYEVFINSKIKELALRLNRSGEHIEVTDYKTTHKILREDVYQALNCRKSLSLMVFDNVNPNGILTYLPRPEENKIRVIMTSINANECDWENIKKTIYLLSVKEFNIEESILNLLVGVKKISDPEEINKLKLEVNHFIGQEEELLSKGMVRECLKAEEQYYRDAYYLVKNKLHNYPLLIVHAITYMKKYLSTKDGETIFATYNHKFGKGKSLTEASQDYATSISEIFSMTINELYKNNHNYHEILIMLIMLHDGKFDRSAINNYVRIVLGMETDEDEVCFIIESFQACSLITSTGTKSTYDQYDKFFIHDAVRDILLRNLASNKDEFMKYWQKLLAKESCFSLSQKRVLTDNYRYIWGVLSDTERDRLLAEDSDFVQRYITTPNFNKKTLFLEAITNNHVVLEEYILRKHPEIITEDCSLNGVFRREKMITITDTQYYLESVLEREVCIGRSEILNDLRGKIDKTLLGSVLSFNIVSTAIRFAAVRGNISVVRAIRDCMDNQRFKQFLCAEKIRIYYNRCQSADCNERVEIYLKQEFNNIDMRDLVLPELFDGIYSVFLADTNYRLFFDKDNRVYSNREREQDNKYFFNIEKSFIEALNYYKKHEGLDLTKLISFEVIDTARAKEQYEILDFFLSECHEYIKKFIYLIYCGIKNDYTYSLFLSRNSNKYDIEKDFLTEQEAMEIKDFFTDRAIFDFARQHPKSAVSFYKVLSQEQIFGLFDFLWVAATEIQDINLLRYFEGQWGSGKFSSCLAESYLKRLLYRTEFNIEIFEFLLNKIDTEKITENLLLDVLLSKREEVISKIKIKKGDAEFNNIAKLTLSKVIKRNDFIHSRKIFFQYLLPWIETEVLVNEIKKLPISHQERAETLQLVESMYEATLKALSPSPAIGEEPESAVVKVISNFLLSKKLCPNAFSEKSDDFRGFSLSTVEEEETKSWELRKNPQTCAMS